MPRLPIAVKLTLAFAAVAVGPIVGMAVLANRLVADRYRAEFARRLDGAEAEVRREFERAGSEVQEAVRRVARADDPLVGQVLLDLAKGALDEERQRALLRRLPGEMRAIGLDAFALLDGKGTILAAGHHPGRAGELDGGAGERARRHPGRPLLIVEPVLVGGAKRDALMVAVAQPVQTEWARVIVVGGRRLPGLLLDRLQESARLLGPAQQVLATTAGGFPTRPYPRRTIPLPPLFGADAAAPSVEVAVPDEGLHEALSWIRAAAAAAAGAGLALAILLGALAARRVARPLGELAAAARRVATGDLRATVDDRRRDEIGELARAWNGMLRDLDQTQRRLVQSERVAAWREIARRIAHEVKNPLTPIQMAVETLGRVRRQRPQLFDEVFDESSRTILDEVQRLRRLAGEFSAFARLPEPRLALLDPGEVVEGALGLYAAQEPAVERRIVRPLPSVRGDREQLVEVLRNLIENAREAMVGRPGVIQVAVEPHGGGVAITVIDQGPGIDPTVRERLFTPYVTSKPQGTGLGLAIVQRIVSDHGGDIRADDADGGGARFTVFLPGADPPRAPPPAP